MTPTNKAARPVQILSDSPAMENPVFGFDAYAAALSGLIAGKTNATPLAVAIHGSHGSGKTTLMKAIKARLEDDALSDRQAFRRCKTVWFQAWKYNDRDDILAALIETILKAMAADGFFSLARPRIDTLTRRFDKSKIYDSISKLVTGVDITEFFSALEFRQELHRFETFQRFFDDLVWTFLNWRFKLTSQEKPDDRMGAMVIFIDDLDPCQPAHIAKIIEIIKLYMDLSGFIFVLGACDETLLAALTAVHGPLQGRALMEKIIQVDFTLPRIPPEAFVHLVEESAEGPIHARMLDPYLPVIMPALGHNPRTLKRLVNSLNLLCDLVRRAGLEIEYEKVLFWWMVTCLFKDLAADLEDSPDRLAELREVVRRLKDKYPETPVWQLSQEQLDAENAPASLLPSLQRKYFSEIMMDLELTAPQIQCLRLLSGSVGLPGETD
jgi:KAP family P-loop domain